MNPSLTAPADSSGRAAPPSPALVKLVSEELGISRRLAEVAVLSHQLLSEKQIAAVLDIPRHTVHGRFRRLYRTKHIMGSVDLALQVERIVTRSQEA